MPRNHAEAVHLANTSGRKPVLVLVLPQHNFQPYVFTSVAHDNEYVGCLRTGITVELDTVVETMMLLAELQSDRCALARPEVLVYQKELLWRIGQALDRCHGHVRKHLWSYVSAATKHKMGGQQLQLLYEVMGRQGYCSQSLDWVDTRLEGAVPSCADCGRLLAKLHTASMSIAAVEVAVYFEVLHVWP
jgi:hypothetical protein